MCRLPEVANQRGQWIRGRGRGKHRSRSVVVLLVIVLLVVIAAAAIEYPWGKGGERLSSLRSRAPSRAVVQDPGDEGVVYARLYGERAGKVERLPSKPAAAGPATEQERDERTTTEAA